MANHCWNSVTIEGDPAKLALLEVLFNKYEDYNYLVDWANEFFPDMKYKPIAKEEYNYYGTKWWEITCEHVSDRFLTVTGDSAWNPPCKFLEMISSVYQVRCTIHFSESGNDFAGIYEWDNGTPVQKYDCSYAQYVFDEEDGIQGLIREYLYDDSCFEYQKSAEEFLQNLGVEGVTDDDKEYLKDYYKENKPSMLDKQKTLDELLEICTHLSHLEMNSLAKKVKEMHDVLHEEWESDLKDE